MNETSPMPMPMTFIFASQGVRGTETVAIEAGDSEIIVVIETGHEPYRMWQNLTKFLRNEALI